MMTAVVVPFIFTCRTLQSLGNLLSTASDMILSRSLHNCFCSSEYLFIFNSSITLILFFFFICTIFFNILSFTINTVDVGCRTDAIFRVARRVLRNLGHLPFSLGKTERFLIFNIVFLHMMQNYIKNTEQAN